MRHLITKCVVCRRRGGKTSEQKMADLPEERTTSAPPFTYCGVDLFGPFQIKQGRKEVKRYGVLLTCLASRGVHIETADSLETDSFMDALRRFIARRGPVREIRSDQGTNILTGLSNGKGIPRFVSYGWRLGTSDTICSIHLVCADGRKLSRP